jgi:hypothetical protein
MSNKHCMRLMSEDSFTQKHNAAARTMCVLILQPHHELHGHAAEHLLQLLPLWTITHQR